MATGRRIKADDQPLATWRGGTTRAIYAYPAAKLTDLAAAHVWVGTASIERPGAYSVFPKRTRVHLPMRGHGLQLHFQQPTEVIKLATFDQYTFAGDRPLSVTLVDGPVEAFNLIFHPTVQAEIQVRHLTAAQAITLPARPRLPLAQLPLAVQVLYMINGECVVEGDDGQAVALQPDDAFVCEPTQAWRVRGTAPTGDVVVATLLWPPAG